MAKKSVSEMESMHGIYQGFFTNLWDVVREMGVPFAAIYRLANVGGRTTLGKMIDLAHADWLDEQPKPIEPPQSGGHPYRGGGTSAELPKDHYLVPVTYAALPSFSDLKGKHGKDNVSVIFDGRPFQKHASCVDMVETPGDKYFWVAAPPAEILNDSEKIIAWGDKQRPSHAPDGYRPATEKEWYEFQKAHFIKWLVALGSFAMNGGHRLVAALRDVSGRRILGCGWFVGRWRADYRFLFVRK